MKSYKLFIEEEMTLGGFVIARANMPQIEDLDLFGLYLKEVGVVFELTHRYLDSIKPTQIDFDQAKVDRILTDIDSKSIIDSKPIVVSRDGFILDGHHRYFAVLQAQQDKILSIVVDEDINKLLKLAYDFVEADSKDNG